MTSLHWMIVLKPDNWMIPINLRYQVISSDIKWYQHLIIRWFQLTVRLNSGIWIAWRVDHSIKSTWSKTGQDDRIQMIRWSVLLSSDRSSDVIVLVNKWHLTILIGRRSYNLIACSIYGKYRWVASSCKRLLRSQMNRQSTAIDGLTIDNLAIDNLEIIGGKLRMSSVPIFEIESL